MKVLVEGSGRWEESPLQMDTVLSWLGSVEKDWKCVRSSQGMEIWQSVWLTLEPQEGEKERKKGGRSFEGFYRWQLIMQFDLVHV